MTSTARYLFGMLVFLGLVGTGLWLIKDQIVRAFMAQPYLNGMIVAVLAVGILYIFYVTIALWPENWWMRSYQRHQRPPRTRPRLLGSLARMIGARQEGRIRLTVPATRSILDGVNSRLDEHRDLARYMIGLLVFLGLLGTFWGLLITIQEVTKVIDALSVKPGEDFSKVFERFKTGLTNSLGGAGTAFSTSLFGLSGSLVLGFLDLRAGQAQRRFYAELEDWLSGLTRLSSLPDGEEGDSITAYLQSLLEHTADTMDRMSDTLSRGEAERLEANQNLAALTERLGVMSEQMRTEQHLMAKLAETQIEMKPIVARLADEQAFGRQELINQLRNEFRALTNRMSEVQWEMRPVLQTIGEESASSREDFINELRKEFKTLAQTIATISQQNSGKSAKGEKPEGSEK